MYSGLLDEALLEVGPNLGGVKVDGKRNPQQPPGM